MPLSLYIRRAFAAVGRWTANFVALVIILVILSAIILVGFPLVLAIVLLLVLLAFTSRATVSWRRSR